MKALIALLTLALISPVSAETSFYSNATDLLKIQLERAAQQFLNNSREAEIEFRYEHRAIGRLNLVKNNLQHSRKIEQLYCYKIIYRKTPDGRIRYEIESRTTVNGQLKSRKIRT